MKINRIPLVFIYADSITDRARYGVNWVLAEILDSGTVIYVCTSMYRGYSKEAMYRSIPLNKYSEDFLEFIKKERSS